MQAADGKNKANRALRVGVGLAFVSSVYRAPQIHGTTLGANLGALMAFATFFVMGMWLIWTKPGTARRLLGIKKKTHGPMPECTDPRGHSLASDGRERNGMVRQKCQRCKRSEDVPSPFPLKS